MAKRLTDTQKWDDEFFMELSGEHKLFFLYLFDNCDHAGFWKRNMALACFKMKFTIIEPEALSAFGDRIRVLDNGKWWIRKFIDFQYKGVLNDNDKVHRSVLALLADNGIDSSHYQGPSEGLARVKDDSKVKVKVKDMVKDMVKVKFNEAFWEPCPDKRGKEEALKAFMKLSDQEQDLAIKQRPLYDAECKRKGTEQHYVKSPAPWLNAKRFNDLIVVTVEKERGLVI